MNDVQIRELHKTLVEILDYFVSVCEENHLRYFLVYGSALGAYRHGGFIPWDDDLDIGMPREDYTKLIAILKEYPSEKYQLQFSGNEPNWFLTFSKIRKNNTTFIESIADSIYDNNGIYIDIFPLDYVRDNTSFEYKIRFHIINYLRHGLKFLFCIDHYRKKESVIRFMLDNVITSPLRLFSKHGVLTLLNRMCSAQCSQDDAQFISEYDEPKAIAIPLDYYFPPKMLLFEGKQYCVPGKIERYLEYIYGPTYMQIPPLEERRTHQPIELRF